MEKSIVEQLKLVYQDAHQFAQRLEQAAIRDAGISWRKYQTFIQAHLKEAESHPNLRIPPDLALKPYRDEDDYPLLRKMHAALSPSAQRKVRPADERGRLSPPLAVARSAAFREVTTSRWGQDTIWLSGPLGWAMRAALG